MQPCSFFKRVKGLFEYGIGMKLRTMGIPSIHDFFRAAVYNPVDSFFMDKYCIKKRAQTRFI